MSRVTLVFSSDDLMTIAELRSKSASKKHVITRTFRGSPQPPLRESYGIKLKQMGTTRTAQDMHKDLIDTCLSLSLRRRIGCRASRSSPDVSMLRAGSACVFWRPACRKESIQRYGAALVFMGVRDSSETLSEGAD
jgi:hypothetical protein